jgi:hypothetical protein
MFRPFGAKLVDPEDRKEVAGRAFRTEFLVDRVVQGPEVNDDRPFDEPKGQSEQNERSHDPEE